MSMQDLKRTLFVRFNVLVYWISPEATSRARGKRHLLLTTTGARSKRRRTLPLTCMIDGEDLYVVASNWGGNRHPAWWYNVNANSIVSVQFGAERRRMRAHTLSGDDRESIWPRLVDYNPNWQEYQDQVGREIPVVRLSAVTHT